MNRARFASLLLLSCVSCGRAASSPQETGAPALPVVPAASAPAPPAPALKTYEALRASLGADAMVEGTVAQIPHQHMMAYDPGAPESLYLDLEGGAQIVVMSAERIPCGKRLRVTGRVSEVSGAG